MGFVVGFMGLFLSCGVAVLVKELVMNYSINALSCVIPHLTFTQLPATEINKNGNEPQSSKYKSWYVILIVCILSICCGQLWVEMLLSCFGSGVAA